MIKEGDFIEVEYIGRIKEDNKIFDLTDEKTARENNIYDSNAKYGAKVICIGQNNIVKGLDEFLKGKEVKNYKVELKAEEAFGKKDPKLLKVLPISTFRKQKINPFPGLHVNFDGILGTIKAVSGGRVIVDFNHPIAGRDIIYEIKVKKILKDDKEKIKAFILLSFGKEIDFKFEKGKLNLNINIPKEIQDIFSKKIKEIINTVKEVNFQENKNN